MVQLKLERNKKWVDKKNNHILVFLVIILLLVSINLGGYIVYGKVINNGNDVSDNNDYNNNYKSVVSIKSLEIDKAEVVNWPNNHMSVSGKFVLEGSGDDYTSVGLAGYCVDTNDNHYEIKAPGIAWHKYLLGENDLDAAESNNYDYGKEYNIYNENADDKSDWQIVKFKYCKFYRMTTTLVRDEKTIEISENINFEKSFN